MNNVFRYLIAKYKPLDDSKQPINIGVIVQSDEAITCKFNKDLDSVAKVVGKDAVNKLVFINLEDTFKHKFEERALIVTDKETGEQKEISYNSPSYIDYLSSNFLNNYIFEYSGEVIADDIEKALIRVYRNFVNPQYRLHSQRTEHTVT